VTFRDDRERRFWVDVYAQAFVASGPVVPSYLSFHADAAVEAMREREPAPAPEVPVRGERARLEVLHRSVSARSRAVDLGLEGRTTMVPTIAVIECFRDAIADLPPDDTREVEAVIEATINLRDAWRKGSSAEPEEHALLKALAALDRVRGKA